MAIARITAQDTKNNSATTTVVTTYGSAPTVGNLLVCTLGVAGSASAPTVADTDGSWTQIVFNNEGVATRSSSIFAKIATGSATAVTATRAAATNMYLNIYEFSGASSSLTGQTANTDQNTAGTTSSAAAITLSAADSMLMTVVMTSAAITATSVDSSYTKIFDNVTGTIRTVDAVRIPAATGTYTPIFSWTSSRTSSVCHAEFLAAAAAAANPYPYVGGGYYPTEG